MAVNLASLAAGGLSGSFAGSLGHALATPLSDLVGQDLNSLAPTAWPPTIELLKLYYQDRLTWADFREAVRPNGVDLALEETRPSVFIADNKRRALWESIVRANIPMPPLEDAITYWQRSGARSSNNLDQIWRQHGLLNGWKHWVRDVPNPPGIPLILHLVNRKIIPPDEGRKMLHALGFGKESDREAILLSRFILPSVSDLIRFSVREVWQPDVVSRFKYDEEFPPEFQFWMERQGLGWTPPEGDRPPNQTEDVSWPEAYWRAHWQVLSPQQAMVAVHRLRPKEPGSEESRIEGVPSFTQDDFDRIMKVADFSPKMREWLRGLVFRPLTRVDVRRMGRIGVLEGEELTSAYQDLGYSRQDAERMTEFTDRQNFLTANRSAITRSSTQLREALELGTLTEDEFAWRYYELIHASDPFIRMAGGIGLTIVKDWAADDPSTQLALQEVRTKVRNDTTKVQVKALIKAFVKGRINEEQLRTRLRQVITAENRVETYVRRAVWERDAQGREETLSRVLRWFQQGLIGGNRLQELILELGYSQSNVELFMSEARLKLQESVAKADVSAARSYDQRRRALMRQGKALIKQLERVSDRLTEGATEAQVLRAFRLGVIDRDRTKQELLLRGGTESNAEIRIQTVEAGSRPPKGKPEQSETARNSGSDTNSQGV